jgi:hypothetical protein
MVIVEKKAKSEEVWVNVIFLARRGSEEETGSTQHSIGEGGEAGEDTARKVGNLKYGVEKFPDGSNKFGRGG